MDPLLGIVLSLRAQMDSEGVVGAQFDVSPTFAVPASGVLGLTGRPAMTLPGMVLYDERKPEYMPLQVTSSDGSVHERDFWSTVEAEELMHAEQQRALGPAYWPAYALTLGDAFEPYHPRQQENEPLDYERMWMPSPAERNRFPLFRMSWSNDGSRSYQFLPGYPELLRFEVRE